jgi:glycosyltransferase involved in cell wall biosynthesis
MALPLSISIVCRNNQATIGRTLASVAGLAAEIVAVDSGSTDGTLELLARHGARVIPTQWKGYVATKQMALESCTQPWVLALDSDESLEPELRAAIERALASEGSAVGYRVNRRVWYRHRPLRHAWQPEWRLRLVRRELARWEGLDPHDRLALPGSARIEDLRGDLRHDSIGTFAEFLGKQAGHARLMAQSMHAEGRRGSVLALVTSPAGALLKQLILKQAWRDGWPGWVAAASTGCSALMKHAILLELSRGAHWQAEDTGGEDSGARETPPPLHLP